MVVCVCVSNIACIMLFINLLNQHLNIVTGFNLFSVCRALIAFHYTLVRMCALIGVIQPIVECL